MPNRAAAIKDRRQTETRTAHNKKIKDGLKTLIKKSIKAIDKKDETTAKELVAKSIKAIDKAAKTGMLKKNTRNRRKSRLMKGVNALAKK